MIKDYMMLVVRPLERSKRPEGPTQFRPGTMNEPNNPVSEKLTANDPTSFRTEKNPNSLR